MANIKSAKARIIRTEKEKMQNKVYKTRFKNLVKKIEKAVETGDKETAKSLLPQAVSAIDKAAKIGSIHKNQAARRKSRLTLKVNKVSAE